MKLLRMSWVLECYDKITGELVAEYELKKFDENQWRELLGVSPEEQLSGGRRVVSEYVEFLQQYVLSELDLREHNCVVELCGEYAIYTSPAVNPIRP